MTQTTYDEMPYETIAQRATDPNRLAALGRLYGVEVPSPERAKILEIGCGTGTNLIHIAERFPNSRCVGIDLSERQIADGQKCASESGLRNVELRCCDLQSAAVGDGEFDYVVCHGVYSWVPPHVQQQLLRMLSVSLSEHGLAYMSYNVLPGWRQRGAIRDIMLTGALHQSSISNSYTPQSRLQGAKELLDLVSSVRSRDGDLYGSYVKESLRRFKDSHPAYLFHEYLEEHNSAVLFGDLMRDVELHGLQFVAEAKASLMSTEDLGSDVQEYLSRLGDDVVTREQCLDVIRNRSFRETILCKGHHNLKRDLKASVFKSIHFVSDYRFVAETPRGTEFRDVMEGQVISTPRDEHASALRIIGAAGYAGISFSLLNSLLAESNGAGFDERALMHVIVRLWRSGFVEVAAERSPIVVKAEGIAKISHVARQQIASGAESVIALQHRSCRISALQREILGLCDGQRSFQEVQLALEGRAQAQEVADALTRLLELGFFVE